MSLLDLELSTINNWSLFLKSPPPKGRNYLLLMIVTHTSPFLPGCLSIKRNHSVNLKKKSTFYPFVTTFSKVVTLQSKNKNLQVTPESCQSPNLPLFHFRPSGQSSNKFIISVFHYFPFFSSPLLICVTHIIR